MMSDSNHPNDTAGSEPQLPACLRPGGSIEGTLNRQKAMSSESAIRLHDQLLRDVSSLQRTWGEPIFESPTEDPVLRLCVATQDDGSISDQLLSKAEHRYQQQLEDYDVVLGKLIPQDVRDRVRTRLVQEAYRENTNATAAEDWQVFRAMQQGVREGLLGLPTGLPKLDEMLGGLRGLTFIGADKGVGKTSLALHAALAALRSRPDVVALIYSLDMSKTRIYSRLLSCVSGVDYRTLQAPNKSPEIERQIAEADQRLRQDILPRLRVIERDFSCEEVYQDDDTKTLAQKGLTFRGVLTDCRRLMGACGATQVLIVFDLFQKIDPYGTVADGAATDHYRLDLLAQLQQASANPGRPYGFPIVVISEIRKDAKDNFTRDDLKGDGRMASDADTVMLMWPSEKGHGTTGDIVPTTLRVDKGREGVQRGDLQLWFEHGCFRFHDTEPTGASGNFVSGYKKPPSAEDARPPIDPLAE